MKRFSYVMMGVVLVGSGLLVGCEVPPEITSGFTTGATAIVGSLLAWAFESITTDTTTTTTAKTIFDTVSMLLLLA